MTPMVRLLVQLTWLAATASAIFSQRDKTKRTVPVRPLLLLNGGRKEQARLTVLSVAAFRGGRAAAAAASSSTAPNPPAPSSAPNGPLIDGRGFLRDVYPVIEYDDDEDDASPPPSSEHGTQKNSGHGGTTAEASAASSQQEAAAEAAEASASSETTAATAPPSREDDSRDRPPQQRSAFRGAASETAEPQLARGPTRCYMRARQVPGDGSCLFHALSAGLWLATNGTHHPMERKLLRSQSLFLRRTAVDVLENGRDPCLYMGDGEKLKASQLLQLAAEQQGQTPSEYCAKVREPQAWGGGPEIVALANALRRPIHVYELVWGVADEPCLPKSSKSKSSRKRQSASSSSSSRRTTPRDASSSDDDDENDALQTNASPRESPRRTTTQRWCLRCIAEFGSPRFDRKKAPLHILSCDSRFPHLTPEQMLDQGNHFLLLFECDEMQTARAALDAGLESDAADGLAALAKRRRDARVKDLRRAIKTRRLASQRALKQQQSSSSSGREDPRAVPFAENDLARDLDLDASFVLSAGSPARAGGAGLTKALVGNRRRLLAAIGAPLVVVALTAGCCTALRPGSCGLKPFLCALPGGLVKACEVSTRAPRRAVASVLGGVAHRVGRSFKRLPSRVASFFALLSGSSSSSRAARADGEDDDRDDDRRTDDVDDDDARTSSSASGGGTAAADDADDKSALSSSDSTDSSSSSHSEKASANGADADAANGGSSN